MLTPKTKTDDDLKVQYDPVTGPTVKGLKVMEVQSWPEVKRQFKIGNDHRCAQVFHPSKKELFLSC